jgi:hypothetical protein
MCGPETRDSSLPGIVLPPAITSGPRAVISLYNPSTVLRNPASSTVAVSDWTMTISFTR